MTHEFDVFDEHCVQLTIFSAVKPIVRQRTLQKILPDVKFTFDIVEQDLFSTQVSKRFVYMVMM